jgi:RHS repeat-associated protein
MSVTDASGATTELNYNFSYGLLSSKTDPNGFESSWTYGDGFGRTTQETRPDGTYTTYGYSSCNSGNGYCGYADLRLSVQMNFYGSDGSSLYWTAVYKNAVDAIRFQEAENFGGAQTRVVTYYDALGRIVRKSMPFTPTGTEYDATYGYDMLNRVVQMQRPISQSDSTLETTSYNYAGDVTTITDPNENTRTLTKDVNGWLRQTEDAMGYTIILGYDAAGSKTSVADSLGHNLWSGTYAYGIAPFLIGESDKDRGAWGYTVDALGERTAWTDAKGQQFYESYDALSRPLTRTEPDLFTQWTWGSSAANHNVGQLASVCSGTGSACSSSYYSETESYDSLGRPYQRLVAIPSMGSYTYTWQYSTTTGLLNTLTYPVGASGQSLELQYAYQDGILQSITDVRDSPNVTIWQANAVDPAGQVTQQTLSNGLLVTNRAYDSVTQWLSSVQSGPGGGASIQNLSFLYDEVGNVTQRQDGIHDLSEDIYYDNDYRLSYSTLGGTQNLSMGYDSMGNITNKSTVSNSAAWTYDAVHLHQVREAGSASYEYTYDANGNMTSWAGQPITWASYNYPTKISGTSDTFTFAYAPDRSVWREIQTGGAGATTYRLGSPLMSIVVGSSGTTDRNYIYAGNEPVAIDERTSASNTFYYLLTDHQGSISGITNSSGQVVINESFHPDGQRRNPSTWTDPIAGSDVNTIQGISARGYDFKETLEYMNLIDFGGRIVDVLTGRFLSADPDVTDPTNPQGYNRYGYAVNNPATYVDPSGFDYVTDFEDTDGGGGGAAAPVLGPSPCGGWTICSTPLPNYCGSNIFCVANVFGGGGVLENLLSDPQYWVIRLVSVRVAIPVRVLRRLLGSKVIQPRRLRSQQSRSLLHQCPLR